MLSMHSSPLAQPGVGDSGGMNVYVRELSSALAQAGVDTTTYVRRWSDDLPDEVAVEPGFRVVHIDAGRELPDHVEKALLGQVGPATGSSTTSTSPSSARSTRSPASRPRAATRSRPGGSWRRWRSSAAPTPFA